MGLVEVNGFKMNVDVHTGMVPMDTVFLHGNLASNNWWKPALEVWAKGAKPSHEGSLLLGEWRGCGKSGHPVHESELNMETLADDYIAMLRQKGIHKACLVGHSTGGLIGLIAMAKAPELFDRAVLLDPVAATGIQFGPEMYDAFTQMSKDRTFCEAVMGGTIHNNDPARPLFQQLVDDAFGIGAANWHGVPKALAVTDITSQLAKIQQPVLVLHGELDNVLPKEGSVALADKLPNGKFVELKGQGHSTNVENPELFVQLVNDFLFNRA